MLFKPFVHVLLPGTRQQNTPWNTVQGLFSCRKKGWEEISLINIVGEYRDDGTTLFLDKNKTNGGRRQKLQGRMLYQT